MKNIIILFTISLIVLICIIGSMAGCVYRYAITDSDCWFANDPIVCQKVKESSK